MMNKTKFVLGMSMVVALLTFTAVPAFARWTNHGGKGVGHSGEVGLTIGGASFKCSGSEGFYKINSEGTVLTLEAVKWVGCGAVLTCENLEMKQSSKEGTEKGKAIGSQISSECLVKIEGACEIKIPTEGNSKLETITMRKSGSNIDSNVSLRLIGIAEDRDCELVGIMIGKNTLTLGIPGLVTEGVSLE